MPDAFATVLPEWLSSGYPFAAFWMFWAVATDMVAVFALVRSRGFRNHGWAALSIAQIFLSFWCMRRVITVIPLGVAYALWCVFGIFGTLAMGWLVFRQTLSRRKCLGIGLLTAGIVLMSLD